MNFYKNIPALIFSIIVILIAILIFSLYLSRVSLNSGYEEVTSKILNDEVVVYENFSGIPHIVSKSDKDLYFAIGYYHAKDRLWQMDILRRVAEGRLSEAFGDKTLKQDLFFRSLEIGKIAKESLDSLPKSTLDILNAYALGVNSYLENQSNSLPFEFGTLSYKPEIWSPYHSILIAKLMAFEMSFSFWSDFAISEIAQKIGRNKASDFIPGNNNSVTENIETDKLISFPKFDEDLLSSLVNNFGNGYTGSNAWAISYIDNKQPHSILANDPHLPINLPSRWYQLHITSDNMNIIGYSIPGTPSIVVGRNDSISWGITNVMADICDIYLVKKGKNDDYYIDNHGNEKEFEYIRDTIRINGEESYQYYKKRTEMSALLSENHLWNNETNNSKFFDEYSICFDWINKGISDEIGCTVAINKSKNYSEFKSSLKDWNAPALVFNYADRTGKVARLPVGKIPIRGKTNPNMINPYWENDYRWKGVKNLQELGEKVVSKEGYIFSANNNFYDKTVFISNTWEPDSRARRIEQLLDEKNFTSLRDFEFMQMDNFSPYANDFLKLTLPTIIEIKDKLSDNEKKALRKLLKWNFILSKDLNEPLIYNYFKRSLIEETIKDELENELYSHYTYLTNFPDRLIMDLLKKSNNWIFDNKNTKQIENKEVIIVKSFKKAVKSLIEEFGIDGISNLTYGDVRKLKLKHIFGDDNFMSPSVNLDAVGLGGDNTTLFNTEARLTDPNNVIVSASMRFITDMNDSLVYMILPGGSSGDPMSSNYGDQVQLWLNGGYLKLNISRTPTNEFNLKTKFKP